MTEEITITESTGSVYKDLGFENSEDWDAKARLASAIMDVMADRQWNQQQAADFLGIKRTEISNIQRGQFQRFTLDRLMSYLCKLEMDVEITVKPRKDNQPGRVAVMSA